MKIQRLGTEETWECNFCAEPDLTPWPVGRSNLVHTSCLPYPLLNSVREKPYEDFPGQREIQNDDFVYFRYQESSPRFNRLFRKTICNPASFTVIQSWSARFFYVWIPCSVEFTGGKFTCSRKRHWWWSWKWKGWPVGVARKFDAYPGIYLRGFSINNFNCIFTTSQDIATSENSAGWSDELPCDALLYSPQMK